MLKSLATTNFQKLGTKDFQFTDGLNLIVGPNWVGKSSLVRAILYALGGPTLAGAKTENLITWGRSGLKVTLEIGELTIIRGPSEAKLLKGDELLASGQTAVTTEIGVQLGIPVKQWAPFYVTLQGEAGELLSASSTKLSGFINEATGVDIVDRVLSRCRDDVQRLIGLVEGVGDLSGELAKVEAELGALDQQIAQGAGNLNLLKGQLTEAEARKTSAQNALEAVRTAHSSWVQYDRERRHLSEQRDDLLKRIAELKDPGSEGSVERRDALRAKLVELSEQRTLHRLWEDSVREHTVSVANTEATIKAWQEKAPSGSVQDLSELEKQAEEAHRGLVTWNRTLSDLTSLKDQAICPTCQRPMEGHEDPEVLAEKIRSASEKRDETKALYSDLSTQLQQVRIENDAIIKHAESLSQWEAYLGKLKATLDDLQAKPVAYSAQEDAETGEALAIEDRLISAWTQYQADRTACEGHLARLEGQLAGLTPVGPVEQEQVTACQQAMTEAQDKVKAIWERVSTAEVVQAGLLSQQSSLHLQHEGLQARVSEYQHHAERLELVKTLQKYLASNRDRFVTEVWNQILSYASAFVSKATHGEVSQLTRTPEGGFTFVENGHETPIEVASGMQKAILGVALKLSLGAALGGAQGLGGVMLFDEVTAAGSDENALLLTGLLAEAGRQVIMVSHRQADAVVAANVVELG